MELTKTFKAKIKKYLENREYQENYAVCHIVGWTTCKVKAVAETKPGICHVVYDVGLHEEGHSEIYYDVERYVKQENL
jgi:hypothetical protein